MKAAMRPELSSKGKESDRRPAFELEELRAMRSNFDAWIERWTVGTYAPFCSIAWWCCWTLAPDQGTSCSIWIGITLMGGSNLSRQQQ